MTLIDAANDFLMSSGGKTAGFPEVGTTVRGTVLNAEPRQQADFDSGKPKFWDDGKPMMELVITLQTKESDPDDETDDGVRKLYAKGNMLKAIREAVRSAGGLHVGGELAIQYSGDGEQKKRGFSPPKLYKAKYEAPTKSVDLEGDLF